MHAHRTTTRLAAIGIALVFVLAACGSSGGSDSDSKSTTTEAASSDSGGGGGKTIKISIKGFKFSPDDIKAKVGDTIEVTNDDGAAHTFTSTDAPEEFDSGDMKKGKTFKVTLKKKGTYNYECSIHDYMIGKIEVS